MPRRRWASSTPAPASRPLTPSAAEALRAQRGRGEVTVLGVDGRPMRMPLSSEVTLPLGGQALPRGGWETAVSLKTSSAALGDFTCIEDIW